MDPSTLFTFCALPHLNACTITTTSSRDTTQGSNQSCSIDEESDILSKDIKYRGTESFSVDLGLIPLPMNRFLKNNLQSSNFKELKGLAQGPNSDVYKSTLDDETVVIKIISKKSNSDPIAVKEFELEKRILESLSHSNIVNIIGSGEFPRQFLVLEYLENGTLEQLLRHRRLELNEVIAWAIDLANAIDFMHSSIPGITIIHRDLKPANIGFSNNVIKLLDFGLSACVKQRSSINESYAMTGCTGSLRYMAPEVWLCRPYNETVDVYSLGVILWQMMTGATPFNDIKTKQAFHNTVVAGGSRPFVSPFWHSGIAELLRMCWHANSVLRPSSKSASALLRGIALSACACL